MRLEYPVRSMPWLDNVELIDAKLLWEDEERLTLPGLSSKRRRRHCSANRRSRGSARRGGRPCRGDSRVTNCNVL